MKSAAATFVAASLLALAAATPSPAKGKEQPSAPPVPSDAIVQGCYSSHGQLVFVSSETYNSRGKCGVDICQKALKKPVAATTNGRDCFCGDKYPSKATLADDKNCNIPCTGFGDDACTSRLPSRRVWSGRKTFVC